jgi:hypothetical protein
MQVQTALVERHERHHAEEDHEMCKIRMVRRASDQCWSFRIFRQDGTRAFKSCGWFANRDYVWRLACVTFDQYIDGL